MIIIGITGSIGMGKSTIALMLKFLKIPIHDSDNIVKLLLKENLLIIDKIKKNWPSCIINVEKKEIINKEELAKIIFDNKKEKVKLEKIIHPYVVNNRNSFINKNKNKMIIGLDVPLLYETNTDKICNYVFLASASKKIQKIRVLKRSNMNMKKFNKINDIQLSDLKKKKKNPIIITTEYGKIITFTLVILNILWIIIKKRKIKL